MARSDPQFEKQWQERIELAEIAVALERHAFFELPVEPHDYLEHPFQLTLPVNETAAPQTPEFIEGWLGIRFRNLDARTPFVDILTRQNPQLLWQHPSLQAQILALIHTHYAKFAPHGFTLTLPVSEQVPFLPSHQVWSQVWWQALAQCPSLAHRPLHLHKLQGFDALDFERFQSQYQFWRLLHQDLAPWVQAASEEELQQSIAAGLCYRACTPEGEEVGLIAGLPSPYRDQHGVLMLEEFIYPTYQGQGYGKALQAEFIETLQHSQYEAIWGTIHSENTASWRTAQACGRQLTEQECFFPL